MADNPVAIVESIAFLAVMLFVLWLVIEALEAAPIGFSTEVDDYMEDTVTGDGGVWEEF